MQYRTDHELLEEIFETFLGVSSLYCVGQLSSEDYWAIKDLASRYPLEGEYMDQSEIDSGIEILTEFVDGTDLYYIDNLLLAYKVSQTGNFFEIDRVSWHYKITISVYNFSKGYNEPTNFCDYWRKFMAACIGWTVLAVLIIIILFTIGWAIWMAAINYLVSVPIIIAIAVMVFFGWSITRLYNMAYNKIKGRTYKVDRKPGIIETKYKSWKESYCPMVKYK